MGQFKAPFSLQQLTSSGRQQFVDRAITDSKFAPARDMGAMFSGTTSAGRVGYALGVFNGSGESVRQNNRSHLMVGRVFVEPLAPYTLAEGSSDAGDRLALHVGAAVRGGKPIRGGGGATVVEDADNETAFGLEFAVKALRFSSTAEYYWMNDEQSNPSPGPDLKSRGYHAQAGFMLVPRTVEVAIRYAAIDGDTNLNDTTLTEVRGGFGCYWQGHNLKLQTDIGGVGYDESYGALSARARQGLPPLGGRIGAARKVFDTQLRLQLQVAF
jgi:hypothetical protein